MEQQALEFITFCTEMYAGKKNISGSEVAKMFCDFDVFDFLEENYLELHTQGREFLIPLIDDFLAKRSKSKYTDDDLLQNESLKVLKFDSASESWLDFVVQNRSDGEFLHDYDLVLGKVANDRVYATIGLYEDGFLDKTETINRLKTFALVDQILFHTEKSLQHLTFWGQRKYVRNNARQF